LRQKVGDTLSMHYRGTLEDGTEFDKSYGRGPFTFPLGAGRVIKGWDQGTFRGGSEWGERRANGEIGLQDMCIGEKRKLIIPYDMAYGERGMGPIPPKATLIFETELLGIKGYDPEKDEL
jgi:FKBP-type peptidyl-prolyl cis-trans isomerase